MGFFSRAPQQTSIKAHKATITYTHNVNAPLERRVRRAARVRGAIARAVKRGNVERAATLQFELDSIMERLLLEKEGIEKMLKEVQV